MLTLVLLYENEIKCKWVNIYLRWIHYYEKLIVPVGEWQLNWVIQQLWMGRATAQDANKSRENCFLASHRWNKLKFQQINISALPSFEYKHRERRSDVERDQNRLKIVFRAQQAHTKHTLFHFSSYSSSSASWKHTQHFLCPNYSHSVKGLKSAEEHLVCASLGSGNFIPR